MDLVAGQNVALTSPALVVRLQSSATNPPDLVALLLDTSGQVRNDSDMVFFNAPRHDSGGVRLGSGGVEVDTRLIPSQIERLVVAAHADGKDQVLESISVVISAGDEHRFEPTRRVDLPTALLVEIYRRNGGWRVRADGQGWSDGLAGLAREFGVAVDDDSDSQSHAVGSREPSQVLSEIQLLTSERDELASQVHQLRIEVDNARASIVETNELRMLQQVGYYQFRHPLDDVLESKDRLTALRQKIKQAIIKRTAVRGRADWMVNGSLKEGAALVREFGDLMLRTYNIEADNCIRTVRAHTIVTAVQRLERTREAIIKNGSTMGISIDDGFHSLRLEELQLTADHHLRVEEEKERAREERQRLRDESKAQEEFKRRKKGLLKEQAHYQSLLDRGRANGDQNAILEARERLAEITDSLDEVDEMAANTRVGYVYVISNVGAFGDDVVKIGMTRREDPLQRVYELGSASVPFKFDVHALVFSQDAVALEAALHRTFDEKRVNRVNRRREFFRAPLPEVRAAFDRIASGHVVEFRELAEAPEWRQSQEPAISLRSGVDLTR